MILEAELKAIIKRYKLTQDELYRHDEKFMLISGRGIRKIITTEQLNVSKRVVIDPNGGVVVTARVEKGNAFGTDYSFYEACGEAKMGLNTSFKFPVAVAEARANSRAVLMSIGLYEKGIIGEAELDMEVESDAIITKRKEQVGTAMRDLNDRIHGVKKKKIEEPPNTLGR